MEGENVSDDPNVIRVVKEDGTVVEMAIGDPAPKTPVAVQAPPVREPPKNEAVVVVDKKSKKRGGKRKNNIDRKEYSDRFNARMGLTGDKEIDFSGMKPMEMVRFYEMLSDPTMLIFILQNLAKAATPDQIVGLLHEGKETVKTLNTARRILTASDPEAQKSMFPIINFGLKKLFGKKDEEPKK